MPNIFEYLSLIPNPVLTWATFFGAGVLLVCYKIARDAGSLSVKDMLRVCVPFNPLKSTSFHGDIKSGIILKIFKFFNFLNELLIISALAYATFYVLEYSLGRSAPYDLDDYSIYFLVFLMVMVLEFSYYLNHYLHHRFSFLWELHKVHHSANLLTPLTDMRGHILSHVIRALIVGVVAGIPAGLIAFHYDVKIPELVLLSGLAIHVLRYVTLYPLKHSHFPLGFGPLDWVIQSPHMHQVHHSVAEHHRHKNLGVNLSIFDWIFGTGYRPAKGESLTFGIGEDDEANREQYDSLRGLFVEPLKSSFVALHSSARRRHGPPGAQAERIEETTVEVQELADYQRG